MDEEGSRGSDRGIPFVFGIRRRADGRPGVRKGGNGGNARPKRQKNRDRPEEFHRTALPDAKGSRKNMPYSGNRYFKR